jgi:nicotinate-nucleotide adenylyltransferase
MTVHRRVGILGGTFDPIHCGHLDAGVAAHAALSLSEILVVPSHLPPHRAQPAASSFHRFAMTALAVSGRSGWRTLDIELSEASRSYTADTLRRFHVDGFSATELFFVVGADAFAEIGSWKDYPDLLDLAHFAVVSRPGFGVRELPRRLPSLEPRMIPAPGPAGARWTSIYLIDAPTADVSSTAIRQACAERRSIQGMVPDAVRQHIEQHGIYAAPAPAAHVPPHSSISSAGRLHGRD